MSGLTRSGNPRLVLGSELSTLDDLRAVMREHGMAVRKAPPLPWEIDGADAESESAWRFEVWELHFDDGSTYGDGLEVLLGDPHAPEWQAARAALCALDLWQYPDQRQFLACLEASGREVALRRCLAEHRNEVDRVPASALSSRSYHLSFGGTRAVVPLFPRAMLSATFSFTRGADMNDPVTVEAIDQRSNLLMNELFEHQREMMDTVSDPRVVYEGWIIQKIASLQLLVIDLAAQVNEIKSRSV